MKKEDLIKMGISAEIAEKIAAEHESELSKMKDAAEKSGLEIDGLKAQLADANAKIKEFDGLDIDAVKKSAQEWEEKYKTETAALQKQLSDKDYEFATREFLAGQKFSSELAKSAVMAQMKEKAFKLEDGKLIGADEFIKEIQEKNPKAFESDEKVPNIVTKSGGETAETAGVNAARAVMGLPPIENK